MKKPSIHDYLDVTQYLLDYLSWKKYLDPSFSITKWATELGFDNKVTLRFILKKRRNISPDTMNALKKYLSLPSGEEEYLQNLIAYSQAKTATEKQALGSILIQLQRKQFKQTMLSSESAARHVFTPVVLTLLTFKDFAKTIENIANLLELDRESTRNILSDLEGDGLVTKLPDQTYHFSENTFRVSGSASLKDFYRYWIERSKAALDMPYEVRRYRALKFALSPEEFQEVTEKLNEYSMLLLSKYQSSSLEGRRLYMYETAVFPISRSLDVLEIQAHDDILKERNQ
ncbi:MAG TPA: TIGR02147 family protein [Bdellovibrio sp.]|uniref:TIGR02147 family protein n=1 Tax=Bdellovibrio sp. TaxID=28201 RepID=UPI002EEBA909